MMSILKQTESAPASWPAAAPGLSTAAAALEPDMIWQRIEAYIAHRWTAREVVWIIEGPGTFEAPLSPATVSTIEKWNATTEAWEAETVSLAPTGWELAGCGPYRLTASVGGGTVPEPVNEAFRRLAEYYAETPVRQGAGRWSINIGGAISEDFERHPAWMARAMQNSGAGDLLRPYRRA